MTPTRRGRNARDVSSSGGGGGGPGERRLQADALLGFMFEKHGA